MAAAAGRAGSLCFSGRRDDAGDRLAGRLGHSGDSGISEAAAGATGSGAGRPIGAYAITFASNSALSRLNPGAHTATLAGFAGVSLTDAASRGRALYAISFTGRSAIIGRFGRGLASAGDLAFAHGRLFATVDRSGSTWSLLATVNIRTGAAKIIGPAGYQDVYGLVTSKGALYGATFGGKFLAISPRTGRGKVIWADGLAIGGLAAANSLGNATDRGPAIRLTGRGPGGARR